MIRLLLLLVLIAAGFSLVRSLFRPRVPRVPSSRSDHDVTVPDDAIEVSYDGSEELALLVSSPDPVAVQAYRGALDSAGIPTVIFDETASSMLGRLPTIAMRVMVPVSRLREARAVIDDLEPGTFSGTEES